MEKIILNIAIGLPGFLLAVVAHEWAHAYIALKFGDQTAKNSGRLTLNPAAHVHPFGTILLPLLGAIAGWPMFGWAKPVPVDVRYFKKPRSAIFWVSFAGPGMNILLGIFSSFLLAIVLTKIPQDFYFVGPFAQMLQSSIVINFILAVFNLIPFPPLDGSKMAAIFMDYKTLIKYEALDRYWFVFILILWFTPFFKYLAAPAFGFANFLFGMFYSLFA